MTETQTTPPRRTPGKLDFATGRAYRGKAILLTRAQAAQELNRSLPYVSTRVRQGRIAPVAIDPRTKAWLFRLADVQKLRRSEEGR